MRFAALSAALLLAASLGGGTGVSPSAAAEPASGVSLPGPLGTPGALGFRYSRDYTTGSRMGLTVTNYGFFGTNLTDRTPSMEYPLGSGMEHLVRAGLWVGARTLPTGSDTSFQATAHVSTGCVDGMYGGTPGSAGGTEWAPAGNNLLRRSRLENDRNYSRTAVSEQDLIAEYSDDARAPITGLEPHVPLQLKTRVETYSWSFDLASAFVVAHFKITNTGDLLRNVYVGLYSQLVSNNKLLYSGWLPNAGTGPRTWFYSTKLDYSDSLKLVEEHFCAAEGHCITEEVNPYWAGVKFLGSRTVSPRAQPHWQWWRYDPASDLSKYDALRYSRMADTARAEPTSNILLGSDSPVEMFTLGPFPVLERDSSITVDFAFVAGRGREALESHARFAQLAFDLNYVLPTPPPSPKIRLIPRGNALDVYWDAFPEGVADSTSLRTDKHDFEGYRLYLGEDPEKMPLVFQADVADSVPPNTGLERWRLPEPRRFGDDTTAYTYRYRVEGMRDGFKYFAAMTSFDKGDARVPSLESGISQNLAMAFPGPDPAATAAQGISVFPNPYRVEARWDAASLARNHYLWFVGLPARAKVRVYSLAGDLVKSFDFDSSTYRGQGARGVYDPGNTGGLKAPAFSGSMMAWDLISDRDQAVATGLYLYSVEDVKTGQRHVGKFAVIKSDRETGF
ncbi:MAG: hypothetical protein HZB25_12995 [Candidatus Eisenbacteria bacterium]|nr:hypothetical protein [Candidatus Eisenbacteria bacterium]